jgi:glycine/D-amino acid oxidase-like deaminating enzyme/nitrite reductase/ring-hydroxylating ferredoxin subunit
MDGAPLGMHFAERSTSIWKATAPPPQAPRLDADLATDVCVIGAGIAGLSVAYELGEAGKRVIVIDAHRIGGGETAQTTAHLSSALDDHYYQLERMHGRRGARLAYESHDAAITRIGDIVAREGIECEFERLDGYLFLAPHHTRRLLERECAAATRAGFTDVELLERAPLPGLDPGPCLRFPRQGQFHPLRYVSGLCDAILRQGGLLFSQTRAMHIEGGTSPHVITADGFRIHAQHIVVATNTPINDRVAIHSKQAPYRTFAIALPVPAGTVTRALYWDTEDPYHYVRLAAGPAGTHLIVGGEDHVTGERDDAELRFRVLEAWAHKHFPSSGPAEMRWSGQVLEPYDGLAYIGSNPGGPKHVWIATGDSGHGMTHGVIAGMLLRDLVLGQDNPWRALYAPSRKRVSVPGAREYLRIAGTVTKHYLEWLKPPATHSLDEIPLGTGRVIQHGRKRLAVYKDERGQLRACSAVCTHLGGLVHWNSQERSWDCPCHGSRFSPDGEVLSGPALAPLPRVELGAENRKPESSADVDVAPAP